MTEHYDYALVGSRGQIGRALRRDLNSMGTVYEVPRGGEDDMPSVRHLVNAAAFTKFNNEAGFNRYWDDNVVFPLKLAEIANKMGAHYHHLSSHGVAEFRSERLLEGDHPEPTTRMKPYTLSKVIAESLVSQTARRLTIYRVGDVVPGMDDLVRDWRKNHWLSVLFSAGRSAFPTGYYPVWIAHVDDVSRAIAMISQSGPNDRFGTHHLLGLVYSMGYLKKHAEDVEIGTLQPLVDKVLKYVHIEPSLADTVDSARTSRLLSTWSGSAPDPYWLSLTSHYWSTYAEVSIAYREAAGL